MTDGCDPGPQNWQERAKRAKDLKKKKEPVRRPNHHSVLLKTVVNVRFGSIEAPSQTAAIKKITEKANDIFHGLFKKYRKGGGWIDLIRTKDGQMLKIMYTEWAEDHQCALVDDEDGEIDDFKNSEWYDMDGGHPYPSVSVPRHDKNCFMGMAAIALSRHRHEIGDLLDISEEELDRLEANLNRYLGGPNYGKEKSSGEKGQEETGKK